MKSFRYALLVLILIFAVALPLASCGDDDDDDDAGPNLPVLDDDDDSSADDDDVTDDDDDDDVIDDDDDTVDDDDDVTDDDDDDDVVDDDDDSTAITLDLVDGCNPFSTSDECYLPYPSAFFQIDDSASNTGVRTNYPDELMPTGPLRPAFDMTETNAADGVSPAGPVLLHFEKDIHDSFLNDINHLADSLSTQNQIALFDYETGQRVMFIAEMDMNRKQAFPDRYALIIRPMEPMEPGHRHVVAMTRNITDVDGNLLESPEAFEVLRDDVLTTNDIIEDVRDHYEDIFTFLDGKGYERSELLLAWDFMVASHDFLTNSVLTMRAEALAQAETTGFDYVITKITDDPNQYLSRIVEGDFNVPHYLNADSQIEYDANHNPIRQVDDGTYPFTMIIPQKAVTQGGPLPLVVFGHGIFGEGRRYLLNWPGVTLHQLAEQYGAVIIATDWIGLSGGDLDLIIQEILPDLNNVSLVTDRLQQSLVNNLVMTELAVRQLNYDTDIQVNAEPYIDEDRVYYYGISLGGIQGGSFMSISPRIERGVAAVPGSVWLNMIPRSVVWVPIKFYLDIMYPDPLIQQIGIAIIQTRFDHSDPINLTRLLYKQPLPDAPDKTIIIQESIGDCQVPNMTTEMLARAIGLHLATPSIYPVFGLNNLATPTDQSVIVQYHMVDQTAGAMPPETNVPPTFDNGVHSDYALLPHVLEQIFNFLETGTIEQYCTGSCDPD